MHWRNRNSVKFILALGVSALLVSCETVSYYTQAARGQLEILTGREDIHKLLDDPTLTPQLREKFTAVLAIRDFAETELRLPVANNYLTYVDLNREHVVWNVFAAPEFSVDPVSWCYPVAGCVTYRGYFAESAADRYAASLAAQQFDVYTGGVDAYSTLGWFNDSLLSTVINRADYQLAALIFHELAHQVVYVPGDTTFNESFATAVEREGLKRWLAGSNRNEQLRQAEQDRTRQEQFVSLVTRYRDKLDDLYGEELSMALKRERKADVQAQLRAEYAALKAQWNGYSGYDNWFDNSLNNAQLATVSSYNDLVPFFDALLESVGGDFSRFYSEVERVSKLDSDARESVIEDFTP